MENTPYNKYDSDDEYIHDVDEELDEDDEYVKPSLGEFIKNNLKMIIVVALIAICVLAFMIPSMMPVKNVPVDPQSTTPAIIDTPSASATATSTTAPTLTPPTPEPTVPAGATFVPSDHQAPVMPDSQPTVEQFAKAYLNNTHGQAAWLAGMRPLVTDRLYGELEKINVDITPKGSLNTVSLSRDDLHGATYQVAANDENQTNFIVHTSYDTAKLKWIVDILSQ